MVSLTFDDGLPCHYKLVIPELNRRGMKATFFVPIIPQNGGNEEIIFDVRFRDEEWKTAIAWGHEIGAHSVRHRRLKDTPTGEIPMSQMILRDILGTEPRSYAWPFCETNGVHVRVAEKHYDQARGGPDGDGRFNYSSIAVGDWNIDKMIEAPWDGVYMFHGVGQPGSWGNIEFDQFRRFLDLFETSVTFAKFMEGR